MCIGQQPKEVKTVFILEIERPICDWKLSLQIKNYTSLLNYLNMPHYPRNFRQPKLSEHVSKRRVAVRPALTYTNSGFACPALRIFMTFRWNMFNKQFFDERRTVVQDK